MYCFSNFFPAFVPAVLWCVLAVGGVYLLVWWGPGWVPAGPWTVASVYGMILGAFIFLRFKAGGWKRIHLNGEAVSQSIPQSAKLAGLE